MNDLAALRPFTQVVSKSLIAPTDVVKIPVDTDTAKIVAVELPQAFCALTLMLPPLVPKFTVMDGVFKPDTIVAPDGTVHLYCIPSTAGTTLYTTPCWEGNTAAGPETAAGLPGTAMINLVCAGLLPHTLLAITRTVSVEIPAGNVNAMDVLAEFAGLKLPLAGTIQV